MTRGETCWLCEHAHALPAPGSAAADWVVLPVAFAWLYPDSLLLADAQLFATRGLILYGEVAELGDDDAVSDASANAEGALHRRLRALLASLGLEMEPVGPVYIARRRLLSD
jgi:hypothetical protein